MARTRPEPWNSFAAYLTAERGLGPSSISTYLTQVRRILAAVEPLTPDALVAWIDALPSHHRSPHRTAWRCYVAWSASIGTPVPDLVAPEPSAPPPDEVVDALAALLAGAHLRPRDFVRLVWSDQIADPAKAKAFPAKVFFRAPSGVSADLVLLPRAPLQTLSLWAYGEDGPPSPQHPLVPRVPGDDAPMAVTTIQRLIRERRRVGA